MSRPSSAPGSPVVAGRQPASGRGGKDGKDVSVGELATRIRRLQPEAGCKHRRDDRLPEDDLHVHGHAGSSRVARDSRHPPTPSHTPNSLSVPGSPRNRSKSPGGRGLCSSPSIKRPNSLMPGTASRPHSPRSSASPRVSPSPSPRASPARKVSTHRGQSPSKSLRSPLTPTKALPGEQYDLSDPEIAARIGNRAVKTVNKPSKQCDHCKRDLTEEGCTAFGKVFHKECFRCHGCRKKLDGKFHTKDDQAYCAKCFKASQEQCCVCRQKIVGDCVVNNNTYYHPDCMKCHVCDEPLRHSYHFFQNKPICERDFKETQQHCSVCEEVITGTYYSLGDKIYCEKDYMTHMEKCGKCGNEIESEAVRTTGSVYHAECFKCEVCKCSLCDMTFSTDDQNKLYCPQDYTKRFAAHCSVCKSAIVPKEGQTKASRIHALDKDFHPHCFKCEDCSMVLDSRVKGKECWPIRKHVLCLKCNRRRQDESEPEESGGEE